ncbi:hypothetical protein S40288_07480 [Stachybotrys chartarum IBT 40288]|nr:hypothetical protein S40288_07480 [Stachybotrys chartarum IBT 40288]
MSQQHKAPAGPRPANHSPTRTRKRGSTVSNLPLPSSASATHGLGLGLSDSSMLSASSSNNHSLFSFGRNGDDSQLGQSNLSFDFLPSVSFDDLQTSLESASTEFKLTQFPSPTGEGSILDGKDMVEEKRTDKPMAQTATASRGGPNPPLANRPGRTGSILRRPSTSSRQVSGASTMSSASAAPSDAPTAPLAMRNRRQSHYPPVSSTNIAKPPRKSMGPGVAADMDTSVRTPQKRRPSLLSDRGTSESTRTSLDGSSILGPDASRTLSNSRAAKARSVQVPSRSNQGTLLSTSTLTPDQNRLSTLAARSPRGGSKVMTPSSTGKRASMMPGSHHSSHATGLGARTISPTDTRRMKRMSIMPQSQSLNVVTSVPHPPPVSMETRADSRSPSMIPRKTSVTPSSARTTPDPNRKSYSSGLSVGSNISGNTVRTSTGSLQPRLPHAPSTSRLPAPKLTTVLNPMPHDDDEDVPPVPAIPKAYESPKDSPADHYFTEKRKTSLTVFDGAAAQGNSTATGISMPVCPEPTKSQPRPSARTNAYIPSTSLEEEKTEPLQNRKSLQPLSLPPITLGPLSIPTAAKVAALRDHHNFSVPSSPPPSRVLPKTPTTPMTASKSSFFSRSRDGDTLDLPSMRSSSSVHHTHHITPTPDATSSDSSLDIKGLSYKSSISPFLSSSAPKGGADHGFLKRSKTGSDLPNIDTSRFDEIHHQKPAGPRPQNTDKQSSDSPAQEHSTDEPATPSSITSLRRKLSLSWKRSNKNGTTASSETVNNATAQQQPGKSDTNHSKQTDHMPPPRLPASATASSKLSKADQSSATPVKQTGGYLESKRRKSSAASMGTIGAHDRTKSDTWGGKDFADASSAVPVPRSTSVMHKILKPRGSSAAMRNHDPWTAELDKEDLAAEEEMRKLGSRRKETDVAARTLDALRKRASPKERVGPQEALRIAMLNIYERGEIIDYDDVYFCGTQHAHKVIGNLQSDAPNFGYDDERGDYTIVAGDHLAYRYEIVDVLGKGSFGQVVRCIDHKLGVLVAVKIIRNKKRFHQQALVEVNILKKLREWDSKNKHSMVSFTQSFYFRGHLCISTELLDMNLYELIKAHSFRGFSLRIIRRFTKQMLSSLVLLKQHKVIHCDLKPENILLRHPLHAEIKVIDFGSSCFENEKVYTYIQSRFYRSPEVILGMTYGMPIDMWSVGCILAELFTGVPIFPGENEQEQLACIMEVFGPPEKHLIEKSTRKKLFFDSMGKPRLTVSSKGRRRRPSSKTLQQVLKCDDEAFLDFVARCLRWDPDRRMKPEDAIRHEYITGQKGGAPAPLPRIPIREPSPARRIGTLAAPRPLPEPPGGSAKAAGSQASTARTGVSPHKPVSGAARRTSGATGATVASASKRTSAGSVAVTTGASNLPRAAVRSTSGRQDLAAAGATAAMSRRAGA